MKYVLAALVGAVVVEAGIVHDLSKRLDVAEVNARNAIAENEALRVRMEALEERR